MGYLEKEAKRLVRTEKTMDANRHLKAEEEKQAELKARRKRAEAMLASGSRTGQIGLAMVARKRVIEAESAVRERLAGSLDDLDAIVAIAASLDAVAASFPDGHSGAGTPDALAEAIADPVGVGGERSGARALRSEVDELLRTLAAERTEMARVAV